PQETPRNLLGKGTCSANFAPVTAPIWWQSIQQMSPSGQLGLRAQVNFPGHAMAPREAVAPRSPRARLSIAIFGLLLCHRLCGNFDQSSTCPNNCSSASTAAPVFAERAYGICRGTCLARAVADQRTSAPTWVW